MDEGSKEELRVYSILQELENREYTESELKKIFRFKVPVRQTRLYKYIKAIPDAKLEAFKYKILQGELVTGKYVKGRTPLKRGKYKITAVIDGVPFIYVKKHIDRFIEVEKKGIKHG